MTARSRAASSEGLYVAAWGGHNAQSHNHNDVGNVLVFSDGQPVFVDAGAPTYTAETFSSKRYDNWSFQSAFQMTDGRLAKSWGTHLNSVVLRARSSALKDIWTLRLAQE